MTTIGPDRLAAARARLRGLLVSVAVLGIVMGIIALVWPGPTLLVVAVLFGISLIVTGAYRLSVAFLAPGLSTGVRAVFGVLGLVILVAGVVCLADPAESLVLLAVVIGVGWIIQGVHDLVSHRVDTNGVPHWVMIGSGVVSVLAGVVVITLPGLAISTFLVVGAILLIVVSAINLITVPRRV
ncbi:HdeD family acid-resistance protein [Williamsia sp. SKLECPSW1]